MTALQTANNDNSVVARQALYAKAGVPHDAICADSGATAQKIVELWEESGGDEALFQVKFKELADLNGASGQCSGHCVKLLDALKKQ